MRFAINVDASRFTTEKPYGQVLDEAFELASIADAADFDMLFVAEHHTIEMAIGPNPFVLLAAWAQQLRNLRLGPAVIATPYWHPIRLAEESAIFDLLSGGRLELGLGRGAYGYEFDRMGAGITPDRAREALGVVIPLLKRLWAGETVSSTDDIWPFPDAVAVPRPQEAPPLWVAARHPDSFTFAVENGCDVMATPLALPFSEVESLVERLDNACSAAQTPRPRMMVLRNTAVYADADRWMEPVTDLYDFSRHFQGLFRGPGSVRGGFVDPVDLGVVQESEHYTPEEISTNHVFGTPDVVVEKLRQYERLGIDHFLYATTPGTDHEFAKESLRLFIDEVMPAFGGGRR